MQATSIVLHPVPARPLPTQAVYTKGQLALKMSVYMPQLTPQVGRSPNWASAVAAKVAIAENVEKRIVFIRYGGL